MNGRKWVIALQPLRGRRELFVKRGSQSLDFRFLQLIEDSVGGLAHHAEAVLDAARSRPIGSNFLRNAGSVGRIVGVVRSDGEHAAHLDELALLVQQLQIVVVRAPVTLDLVHLGEFFVDRGAAYSASVKP